MTHITISDDDNNGWAILPDEYARYDHYTTLDLPDKTVEWLKRIAVEWENVQDYLGETMETYYRTRKEENEEEYA